MDQIGPTAVKPIPQEKYALVQWSEHEKLFTERPKLRNQKLIDISVPFTLGLMVKLRKSVLGTYLKYFNEAQWQDEFLNFNKMAITESIIKDFDKMETKLFNYDNNLMEEMVQVLKSVITQTEEIDCSFLYQNEMFLRLDDYSVNNLDDGLQGFKNLQVLVLCGNWIKDIHGSVLPRNLKFLELYANELKSVKNLTHKAPKHLLHLGLGRNKLGNDSSLHLLAESGRFNRLKTLDLSECDIYHLENVLKSLATLQNLEALHLQGNPCSTVMGYKDVILNSFPRLLFLDGTEISMTDRDLYDNFLELGNDASLIVYCSQLKGLPPPPKPEKNCQQTIHFEIALPLFQEDTKTEIDDSDSNHEKDNKKKDKGKKDKTPRSKKSKSEKGGSKKSLYNKENEYNPKLKNNSMMTERNKWKDNLNFSPILLKSPENNLFAYRDSFRSRVDVRIVYLKFIPPATRKKEKKGKHKKNKDKKEKAKKSKKSSKNSKSDKSSKTDIKEKHVKEPKETILKRVTLAHFSCDLSSLNWKENGMEFYWSDEPNFANKAVDYKKYLEDMRKKEEEKKLKAEMEALEKKKAKQKKHDKKSKSSSKSKKSAKSKASSKSNKSKKSKASKTKGSKKGKKGKPPVSCFVTFDLSRLGKEIKPDRKSETKNKQERKHKKEHKKKN